MTPRKSKRAFVRLLLGAFLATLACPPAASAHLTNGQGSWYFYGSTYKDRHPRAENRKDPLNLIFYNPGVQGVTNDAIAGHIEDDWRLGRKMRQGTVCTADHQYAAWRYMPGGTVDKDDRSLISPVFAPGPLEPPCGLQHHIRLWDDYEHSKGTSHARYQWIVAGVHREHAVPKLPCCFGHKINRDWDRSRRDAIRAMSRHCSYPLWTYHPDADRTYQGYKNSGYLARISPRHVEQGGCSGA